MSTPKLKTVPIADLILDEHNANLGTDRGRKLLESSLKKYGAGRSVLVDKNNRVIAGNKTIQAAIAMGKSKVIVVEADDETIIAVQRGDLDLQTDSRAQGLAIADNRVAELDLNWNLDVLKDHPDPFGFDADELEAMLKTASVKEVEPKPAPRITWLLVGIPMSKYDEAQQHIAALERISNVYLQASRPK